MSNMIDKRSKVARREQEIAHQYPFEGKAEEYQYPDEDKRVKFHVDSDVEDRKSKNELYGIDPDGEYDVQIPTNKIRVRMTKEEITQEHKQQSYKVRTKPQVYDKTDHGLESNMFQLQNDPHKQEVEYVKATTQDFTTRIEEENQRDLTSPNGRYDINYKEDKEPTETNETTKEASIDFKVGMKVSHVEDGLVGKISFVNDKRVAVAWEDNTKERFSLADAREFLAYVDSAQEQVAPTQTTPFPKNEKSKIVEKALNALEGDIQEESKENTAKIDIDKAKLQRQVNELQNQVDSQNIQKIKEKAANELIDLMQKKGMLSNSDEDVQNQFNAIMEMDDNGFESFKNAILAGNNNTTNKEAAADEIYAMIEDNVDDDIEIEDGHAHAKAREEMKKATASTRTVEGIEMGDTSYLENGGLANFKGNIGDFSTGASMTPSSSSRQNESRSLSDVASRRTVQRTASERREEHNGLDLSGFQNLQGIKAPINIPAKETTAGSKFSELFNSMEWTILSKK